MAPGFAIRSLPFVERKPQIGILTRGTPNCQKSRVVSQQTITTRLRPIAVTVHPSTPFSPHIPAPHVPAVTIARHLQARPCAMCLDDLGMCPPSYYNPNLTNQIYIQETMQTIATG